MRAARIEDGIVADLWEVPSLTAFEGITLIEVADEVGMDYSYDGTNFIAPALSQEEADAKAAYDALAWERSRKSAYDLLNQDEMRYDDLTNSTTTWQDAIAAIKTEYPK